MPSILFIVLHYKNIEDTVACVVSLQQDAEAKVLVVDNDPPGQEKELASCLPGIEILSIGQNAGWAGGNNAGIKLALSRGYDAVCLTNNDTVIPVGVRASLSNAFSVLGASIVHPAIDYWDPAEGPQLDPVTKIPPTTNFKPAIQLDDVYEMDAVNGACMAIHVNIFQEIGFLDERFFLQCEDFDFAKRATAKNYIIYCDSRARIKHKESSAYGSRKTPLKLYYIVRSSLLYAQKHAQFPFGYFKALKSLYWTLSHIANASAPSRKSFLKWVVSRDEYAVAARVGALDFLLRRFGAIKKSLPTNR